MIESIIAIERDGIDTSVFSICCEVQADKDFDLISAAKKAATDFCKTKEGVEAYECNGSWFNWSDFARFVPNSFCEKYGFKKVDCTLPDLYVDWDEYIVDDSELEFE